MNSAPISQEKRSIKVKDFLADLRSGMDDGYLLTKYHLTPVGLDKFYDMLVERGILSLDELSARNVRQVPPQGWKAPSERDESSFICPSCLAAHDTMFDVCPCCGVSFQETLSAQTKAKKSGEEPRDRDYFPGQREQEEDTRGDLFASPAPNYGEMPPKVSPTAGSHLTAPAKREADFAQPFDWRRNNAQFDEPLDDIVCGMPLDENYACEDKPSDQNDVRCENCQEAAVPALRDIYDRNRSLLSLTLSGISLFLGLVGAIVVSFFDGYSLARLLVVYVTGLFLLCGGVLCAVGSFMYLAREKVYYCASCGRVYPRG